MTALDPRKLDDTLARMGFVPAPHTQVTIRQIDTTIGVLGSISTEDHEELNGALRDEIGHVIDALQQIADRRRGR